MVRRRLAVDYYQVEALLNQVAEEFNTRLHQEGHDVEGEWIKVRGGLDGMEHCVRVLTPEEFAEWRECVDTHIEIDPDRKPVAFCSQAGIWWPIYEDTPQSDVVARFEQCFEI